MLVIFTLRGVLTPSPMRGWRESCARRSGGADCSLVEPPEKCLWGMKGFLKVAAAASALRV